MKKLVAICTLAIVLSAVAYVAADIDTAITPEKGMVVGTAIEISTYATQGMTEKDIPAMASRCEQGFRLESSTRRPAKCGWSFSVTTHPRLHSKPETNSCSRSSARKFPRKALSTAPRASMFCAWP